MLQTLRTKAAGLVAKFLFLFLIASFAIWGIGDYAFLRQADPTAVQVGDVAIPATRLGNEYRRELENLRRRLGQFDDESARQFGLMDRVIERLVAQVILDKAAAALGVTVGDGLVRSRLLADPQLRGPDGRFDRNIYLALVRENGYSEEGFLEVLRAETARGLIRDVFATGAQPPQVMVDQLYRYRNERRIGEVAFVPYAAFTDVGEPDDAQAKAIYDDNAERFTAPEYRALSLVRVGAAEIAPTIPVTDEQVKEEYDSRLADLTVPERREVEQILFLDEKAARAARDKIVAGTPFLDVARETAGQTPEATKLGLIDRTGLLPEIADAVFGLEAEGLSEPLRSPFGWHLMKVTRVDPGRVPPLDEVKDRLKAEIAAREAGQAAYTAATRLEDAIGARATLEQAAAQIGVPVIKIDAVDLAGRAPDGTPIRDLADAPEALTSAFEIQAGGESPLIESRSGIYLMVRVDAVTPSRVKPLEEVRADVIALWQARKREEAGKQRADTILERIGKGQSFTEATAEFDIKPETTAPLLRSGNQGVPPELAARLGGLKPGESGLAVGRDGIRVVRLTEIVPANATADPGGVDAVRTQLAQQIGGDLAQAYVEALKRRYTVTVNKQVVETLL